MSHPQRRSLSRGAIQRRFDLLLKGLAAVAERENALRQAVADIGVELIDALGRCRDRPEPVCAWCGHGEGCHPAVVSTPIGGCWGDKTAAGDCHCPSYQPPAEPPSCQCEGCVKARLCVSVHQGIMLEQLATERELSEELDAAGVKGAGRTQ